MKIPDKIKGRLIKEIISGTIHRGNYPEIFPPVICQTIKLDGVTKEFKPPEPVTVLDYERKPLAKAVLKGEVDPAQFPEIWPAGGIRVLLLD